MEKAEVNKQIVLMRKAVRKAKVQILRKLIRHAKLYLNKRGNEEVKQKWQRKAERLLEDIKMIKKIRVDEISKHALANMESPEELIRKKNLSLVERVINRVCCHKSIQESVKQFREIHPDWQAWMPPLLKLWRRRGELKGKERKPNHSIDNTAKKKADIATITDEDSSDDDDDESEDEEKEEDIIDEIKSEDEASQTMDSTEKESSDLITTVKKEDSRVCVKKTVKKSSNCSGRADVPMTATGGKASQDVIKITKKTSKNSGKASIPIDIIKRKGSQDTIKKTNKKSSSNFGRASVPIEKRDGTIEVKRIDLNQLDEQVVISAADNASSADENENFVDSQVAASINDPFFVGCGTDGASEPLQEEELMSDEEENDRNNSNLNVLSDKLQSQFVGKLSSRGRNDNFHPSKRRDENKKDGYFKRGKWIPIHPMGSKLRRNAPYEKLTRINRVRKNPQSNSTRKTVESEKESAEGKEAFLHPSWEAKRQLKAKEGLHQFQGKKIVFD